MKHVFVFDPKAFYNQQWKMENIQDNIGQYFRTQEKPDWSIQVSRYRRNAIGIIQEEAEKVSKGDIIRVYAIGGEDILFDCLNAVAHIPNTQLAATPYGETNDFLRIFGHENIEKFVDIPSLVEAEALPTDVIRWGVNYALNSCYIGMNSAISKRVKDLKSNLNKGSFLIFSKISIFINYILTAFDKQAAARKYTITIDDQNYSGSYSLIHIANGPYYAGKITGAAHATPDDGLLDVTLIKSAHPLKTLFSLRRYSRGKLPKNSVSVQAKKVMIQSEEAMWIQMDSEYIQDTNVNLSLIPQATQMAAVNKLTYPIASILGE
uniref:Transcription regulator (Contains diacylglycerol kinase catalytic domain) n=1 Tax=uncultured bacterium contig00010 TaxID=1181502 RepID=A0A806JXZ8_9BACT|nr:transcription regulator (contains diacylglycerol kinase catalytic domain) [uncultured bacterium contig00010]